MSFNHKSLVRHGYILNKKNLTEEELNNIKKELTVTPKVDPDYNIKIESFEVFIELGDFICVPKFYGISKFGPPLKQISMDISKINVQFNGSIRENQLPVINHCLNVLKKDKGGIISLPCGFGKTVIAIYLACQLGLKTLIVVHKTFLQNQWYDRLKQYTNGNIGIIRQHKTDVNNKDFVIGMLQSISMIDYDPNLFKDYGLVIFDEVHRVASKVFSKALKKIGAEYTIGLSATPDRSDGLTKILNWHLGKIIYKISRKEDNNVLVKLFNYNSNNTSYNEKRRHIKGKIKPDIQTMTTMLCKLEVRNNFIIDIIKTIITNIDNRKILILSGRLDHLKLLKTKVDEFIKLNIKSGILDESEIKTAYYIGGMSEVQLDDSAESDIIFATYAMAEEGLDIDKLNTLIFATPKKNIIQSIGRIMRKPLSESDVFPLIIDIIDNISCFKSWGNLRKKYYDKQKYIVNSFESFNDKCITIEELLKLNNIQYSDNKDILKKYICFKYSELEWDLIQDSIIENNYFYNSNLSVILKD